MGIWTQRSLSFSREEYTLEELGLWYQNLLDRYHKWIAYQLAWKKRTECVHE